jgi:hypothetical protein
VDRVQIGCNFAKQPFWKRAIGIPLIYVPILVLIPFLVVGLMLRACLKSPKAVIILFDF